MNIDNIKQVLISKGAHVREDMQAPVDLYDDQAVASRTRRLNADMTADEVADHIMAEGRNIAFLGGITTVPVFNTAGVQIGDSLNIRYAAWE